MVGGGVADPSALTLSNDEVEPPLSLCVGLMEGVPAVAHARQLKGRIEGCPCPEGKDPVVGGVADPAGIGVAATRRTSEAGPVGPVADLYVHFRAQGTSTKGCRREWANWLVGGGSLWYGRFGLG